MEPREEKVGTAASNAGRGRSMGTATGTTHVAAIGQMHETTRVLASCLLEDKISIDWDMNSETNWMGGFRVILT